MQSAQESLTSLLGNTREPSLREQIEEMTESGGGCCCSLTYEVCRGLPCTAVSSRGGLRAREPAPTGARTRAHAHMHTRGARAQQLTRAALQERIIGFAGCVISGLFLNLFSMVRLTELMLGNPKPFAVCFTLGNMLSMGSMLFLVGPRSLLATPPGPAPPRTNGSALPCPPPALALHVGCHLDAQLQSEGSSGAAARGCMHTCASGRRFGSPAIVRRRGVLTCNSTPAMLRLRCPDTVHCSRQLKNLFTNMRRGVPTAVYIAMMVCTLWVAFAPVSSPSRTLSFAVSPSHTRT